MTTSVPRILCVDDDADILLVLQFSLIEIGGFDVRLCGTGAQALAEVEAFGPDLILLDVMMPKMSGPQVLQALRERPALARTPVVFMTAKAMPDELESLLQFGAAGVIVKPFDATRLPQDVRAFLEPAHG